VAAAAAAAANSQLVIRHRAPLALATYINSHERSVSVDELVLAGRRRRRRPTRAPSADVRTSVTAISGIALYLSAQVDVGL